MISFLRHRIARARLKNEDYIYLLEPYTGDELVALDTETTGLNPKKDSILSIGAVIIKENKILVNRSFEIFVRPDTAIGEDSIKVHHIRACDLEDAKESKEAILSLVEFIGNRPIVGYYIDFDRKILSRYTRQILGIDLPNSTIELSSMYYKRYRKESSYEFVDLKFDTIMNMLSLPMLGKHDAMNDALMSAVMYLKLRSMPEYRGAYA